MKSIVFASVALFAMSSAIGCGGKIDHPSTTNYTVMIEPSFTDAEVYDITLATLKWQESVPVKFEVRRGECELGEAGVICMTISTDSNKYITNDAGMQTVNNSDPNAKQMIAWTDWYFYSATAQVNVYQRAADISDVTFYLAMMHELGHAQGMVHHQGCYIMNAETTGCATEPTVNDVDQWWGLRQQ